MVESTYVILRAEFQIGLYEILDGRIDICIFKAIDLVLGHKIVVQKTSRQVGYIDIGWEEISLCIYKYEHRRARGSWVLPGWPSWARTACPDVLAA